MSIDPKISDSPTLELLICKVCVESQINSLYGVADSFVDLYDLVLFGFSAQSLVAAAEIELIRVAVETLILILIDRVFIEFDEKGGIGIPRVQSIESECESQLIMWQWLLERIL